MSMLNTRYSLEDLFFAEGKNKYHIIQNSQTPRVDEIKDVKSFILENKEPLDEFLAFSSSRMGAAVSANQVSVNGKRLMWKVFAISDMVDFFNLDIIPGWQLIINPKITEYIGKKEIEYEGCMSFKCSTIEAHRSPSIKASYYDINGNKHENKLLSGLEAQVWQHEVNHLNGVEETKLPKSFLEKTVCKTSDFFFPLPPIQAIAQ